MYFVSFCRPLERAVTLHKDMNGQLGFIFKKGRITSIVKDSSAARNGLLTDHQICEINGQNVIGLKVTLTASLALFFLFSFCVFLSNHFQTSTFKTLLFVPLPFLVPIHERGGCFRLQLTKCDDILRDNKVFRSSKWWNYI